jgi:formylmethanofuran dehydrogenase subunit E
MKIKRGTTMITNVNSLLPGAEDFHTHLGPFLVLGLKAGLIALSELNSRKGDPQLRAEVGLPYRIPISCLLDGLQYSTGCTVGNKRLSFRESTDITMTFAEGAKSVELTLSEASIRLLRPLLAGGHLDEKQLSDLAHSMTATNENELFNLK